MTSMFKTRSSISRVTKPKGKKVFVGLSGGVDSAVSAALLKEEGYDVTGVFIKVWTPEFLECNWREERRDAMRVALKLNIPFLFLDFEKEYKRGVADYMIEEYKAGRTPNPDILCNREIKFGAFWQRARELGADYIATGHYVQVESSEESLRRSRLPSPAHGLSTEFATESQRLLLLREGADAEKDQSYFLWTLKQEDLSHIMFPVGDMSKKEVRELARKYGLSQADKKDSQGICFLGDVSIEEFISHFVKAEPGDVVNTSGEKIGKHNGAIYYTIGERHGFEVSRKDPSAGAYYVVAKDMRANEIVVSNNEDEITSFSPRKVVLKDVNWVVEPQEPELLARIRYRGAKVGAKLTLMRKRLVVEFDEPQKGLSLGQSVVFYLPDSKGDICIGGAVMDRIVE